MRIDDELFRRIRDARNKKRQPIFVVYTEPSASELDKAELRLGIKLPESYKQFCLALGHGAFNDELLMYSPNEIFAVDSQVIESGELIAFATDDMGNRLAFDLKDASDNNEYAVYYLCHDPYGYGKVAPSFAVLLNDLLSKNFNYRNLIENLPTFTEFPDIRDKNRPWWKFW